MATRERPWSSPARLAVQGWVASRLVLLIVALTVMWRTGASLSTVFTHWDVAHFVDIALHGYTTLTQTAYFPGLPLVMAVGRIVGVPPALTGTLVALVGSGFAAWALYRLAGRGTAGTIAVLAWCFAPMAVFGFVAYTEAPFAALAFWAWWYARRDRWGVAAALAAGACAFRITGGFLVAGLAVLALVDQAGRPRLGRGLGHGDGSGVAFHMGHGDGSAVPFGQADGSVVSLRRVRLAWLGLPVAVLAAYEVYLRLTFGSWLTWYNAQAKGWGRALHWPWDAWRLTVQAAGATSPYGSAAVIFRWEIAAVVIGLAVTILVLAKGRVGQGVYVGAQVLAFSCQIWFLSVARALLVWFPVFTLIGAVGGRTLAGSPTRRATDPPDQLTAAEPPSGPPPSSCAPSPDSTHIPPARVVVAALIVVAWLAETTAMVWWATRFYTSAWAG